MPDTVHTVVTTQQTMSCVPVSLCRLVRVETQRAGGVSMLILYMLCSAVHRCGGWRVSATLQFALWTRSLERQW